VLGGTVSAGCYTAGALDFLFEALDCFTAYQQSGDAPPHKVVLKLITGTSGGGVNAAIAARALAYDYPHITRGLSLAPDQSGNPFYDTWVNTLRLADFLSPSDINRQVRSILNGAPIDTAARQIITFAPRPARARSWVKSPLRVILTVTSLRGIPYTTQMGNGTQSYVDHADFARFALVYPGQQLGEPRPDEEVLAFGNCRR
jgi:predicted acylesterase/phospholipase RssA